MPEPERPTDNIMKRMRFACWIKMAIEQLSERLILTVVPPQQWLREGATMSSQKHNAFVVNVYWYQGTAVAQWLRCRATNPKVADSIPDGVIGIFH